jgi:hypothetical protein
MIKKNLQQIFFLSNIFCFQFTAGKKADTSSLRDHQALGLSIFCKKYLKILYRDAVSLNCVSSLVKALYKLNSFLNLTSPSL